MGFMPVLLVIIVIAGVVSNYNKMARQRLEDEKKRAQKRAEKKQPENRPAPGPTYCAPTDENISFAQPIRRISMQPDRATAPRLSAKDLRSAVILSEILNKPVSLREK